MRSAEMMRKTVAPLRRSLHRRLAEWIAAAAATASIAATAAAAASRGEARALVACATIAALGLLGTLVPRSEHRAAVLGVAAGTAVISTRPETYDLWLAGVALLFLSSRFSGPERPWPTAAAAASGIAAAAFLGDATPMVPATIGATVVLVDRLRARAVLLERRNDSLEARAAASEAEAEWLEQRAEIARELHDVVGHHVTAMVVQAEAGLVTSPHRALEEIADTGRRALGGLDALVLSIRDGRVPWSGSDLPLTDIDRVLAPRLRTHGITVSVRVCSDLRLPDLVARTVYRVAQEALTNVLRHAGARTVLVEIEDAGPWVRLRVTDDGVGLPEHLSRGNGLRGMAERVAGLGGTLTTHTAAGGGAVVEAELPLETW